MRLQKGFAMRVLTVAALLTVIVPGALAAQGSCVVPADTVAQVLLRNVRALASRPDAPYADARARGGIPLTDPTAVTYVTDERVCGRIAQAVAAEAQKAGRTPSNRVRAVKLGDLFVAQDPSVTFQGGPVTYYVTKTYKVARHFGGA
jgi:hypothetical protein